MVLTSNFLILSETRWVIWSVSRRPLSRPRPFLVLYLDCIDMEALLICQIFLVATLPPPLPHPKKKKNGHTSNDIHCATLALCVLVTFYFNEAVFSQTTVHRDRCPFVGNTACTHWSGSADREHNTGSFWLIFDNVSGDSKRESPNSGVARAFVCP